MSSIFTGQTSDDTYEDEVTDASPEAEEVSEAVSQSNDVDLRKNPLYDLVAERSGAKRRDVKPIVDAMLEVLGENLAAGRGMNLPPLGRVRINRTEDKTGGRVIVCKVKQAKVDTEIATDPLADPGEAG